MPTFLKKLNQLPPVKCRLLAIRYPGGKRSWPIWLTDEEVATGSGLSLHHIKRLSRLTNWSRVPIGTVERFVNGCRLNLGNWYAFARITRLAKSGVYAHVRRSPHWCTLGRPLMKILHDLEHGNGPGSHV